ncbi:ANTAR domain-containing protein [Oryzobacter terrae]|uniref:ANTAR domain-containing protein n=1 Tax=Oryzobacter terrae TaxID=1620385 RepID=UPI00366C2599
MGDVVRVGADVDASVSALAEVVSALGRPVGSEEPPALQRLLARGAPAVMGARWAWVTLARRGRSGTVASTGGTAESVAAALDRTGRGPVVDALTHGVVVASPEVSDDERWGRLGRRLREEFGVRSVVSYPLQLEEEDRRAALTFGADRADAFGRHHVDCGRVLASHAALLVAAEVANATSLQLLRALETNREIGVAVGVLMTRHGLTRDRAFAVLRTTSQNTNRKLADIASDVADTGDLPPGLPDTA